MNQVWALVPIKNFAGAKSRLASVLGAEDRQSLAKAMAVDVVTALVRSRTISRTVVVSDVPEAERLLGVEGVEHFDTRQARGLNEDLMVAADWARRRGATHVLIVHADLPLLTPASIDRFIRSAGDEPAPQIRAAACKRRSGTNMLFAPVPLPLPLVFGSDSLAGFRQGAAQARILFEAAHDMPLATDIDDADDFLALILAQAQGAPIGRATAKALLSTEAAGHQALRYRSRTA